MVFFCKNPGQSNDLGVPLYLNTLAYINLLLGLMVLGTLPVFLHNVSQPEAQANLESWSTAFILDEERVKCQCLDYDTQVLPLLEAGVHVTTWPYGFGSYCVAHDKTECQPRYDYVGTDYGTWCCEAWCYVDPGCPFSKGSSVAEGLFYCYDCCKDQNDLATIQSCPWQAGIEYAGEALLDDREWPTVPKEIGTPGNHGVDALDGGKTEGRDGSLFPSMTTLLLFGIQVLVSCFFFHSNDQVVRKYDAQVASPCDYGLLVKGLPLEWEAAQIKDLFEKLLKILIASQETPDETIDFRCLRVVMDIAQPIRQATFGKLSVQGQQDFLQTHRNGVAILVFNDQICNRLIQAHAKGAGIFVGSKKLLIKRAPEPCEISWPSLGATDFQRRVRFALGYLLTIILIPLTIFFVRMLTNFKQEKGAELANLDESLPAYASIRRQLWVIRLAAILLISTVNTLVRFATQLLTRFEFADSKSLLESHALVKCVAVTLANTVLCIFILNPSPKQWYLEDSLALDLLVLMSIEAFSPAFSQAIRLPEFLNWLDYRVRRMWARLTNGKASMYDPQVEMDFSTQNLAVIRYTSLVHIFLALSPLIVIITLAGSLFQRGVDQYLMCHLKKIPYTEAASSTKVFLLITFVGLVVAPISQMLFLRLSMEDDWVLAHSILSYTLSVFGLGLTIAFFFRETVTKHVWARFGWPDPTAAWDTVQGTTYVDMQASLAGSHNAGGYHRCHPLHQVADIAVIPEVLSVNEPY